MIEVMSAGISGVPPMSVSSIVGTGNENIGTDAARLIDIASSGIEPTGGNFDDAAHRATDAVRQILFRDADKVRPTL